MSGTFITFEGIDKSGKTTQAELLVEALRSDGVKVLFTREPGGTPLGVAIRHLVLDRKYDVDPSPEAELLLFAADRAQHVAEVIRPALADGKVVISDRYTDSTLAYQGYGRGMDLARLGSVMRAATGGLEPDLTVVVDVDLDTARARGWGMDPDRIEGSDSAFFQRVRDGFLALCNAHPQRCQLYDGRAELDSLARAIRKAVSVGTADLAR